VPDLPKWIIDGIIRSASDLWKVFEKRVFTKGGDVPAS
jgi:hypothetical protein